MLIQVKKQALQTSSFSLPPKIHCTWRVFSSSQREKIWKLDPKTITKSSKSWYKMSFCVLYKKKKKRETMQVGKLQPPWIPGLNPSRDSPRDCQEQIICCNMIHWPQTAGETANRFSYIFSLVFLLHCFFLPSFILSLYHFF